LGGYVLAVLLLALSRKFAEETDRKSEWGETVMYAPERDKELPNQSH
jgi:hypothetical protein